MERNDRSFVTRGSEIGVFKTNPDGVSYAATIKAALRGEEINAGNVCDAVVVVIAFGIK